MCASLFPNAIRSSPSSSPPTPEGSGPLEQKEEVATVHSPLSSTSSHRDHPRRWEDGWALFGRRMQRREPTCRAKKDGDLMPSDRVPPLHIRLYNSPSWIRHPHELQWWQRPMREGTDVDNFHSLHGIPISSEGENGSIWATRNAAGRWALGGSGKGQEGRDARAGMRPRAGGIWSGTRTTPVGLVATATHLLHADRTRAEQGGAVEPVME
ncbi:unnamed protein product [Urochloa humidicola]